MIVLHLFILWSKAKGMPQRQQNIIFSFFEIIAHARIIANQRKTLNPCPWQTKICERKWVTAWRAPFLVNFRTHTHAHKAQLHCDKRFNLLTHLACGISVDLISKYCLVLLCFVRVLRSGLYTPFTCNPNLLCGKMKMTYSIAHTAAY